MSTQLAFRNGFLVLPLNCDASEADNYSGISHWARINCASCLVSLHPDTRYVHYRHDCQNKVDLDVVLIGIAITPYGESDAKTICKKICGLFLASNSDLDKYISSLSGRYVLILSCSNESVIYTDPFATYACYTYSDDSRQAVASHSTLLANIFSLEVDCETDRIMNSPDYISPAGKYHPALLTPFKYVTNVFANHKYYLLKGRHVRFFPVEHIKKRSVSEALLIVEQQLRLILEALFTNHSVFASLTGGGDSRLTFALAHDLIARENSFFFTALSKTFHSGVQNDVIAASHLARKYHCKHYIVKMSDLSPGGLFDDAYSITFRRGSRYPAMAKAYSEIASPNQIQLVSTISEIGTCFYKDRAETNISPQLLASKFSYTRIQNDLGLQREFEKYIKYSSFDKQNLLGYDFYDMFYWEHRNTKHHGIWYSEADLSHFPLVPFNSRIIADALLSVPIDDRINKTILTQLSSKWL